MMPISLRDMGTCLAAAGRKSGIRKGHKKNGAEKALRKACSTTGGVPYWHNTS